jgi:hypothetical protein
MVVHCAQVLPVEELAGDLTLVEASSINESDTVEVVGQFNRDLFKNEFDLVEVQVQTLSGKSLLQVPSRPNGSNLSLSLSRAQIDEALTLHQITSVDQILVKILKSGVSLKEFTLSYSFDKVEESGVRPLTAIEASSECSLETQKDGSKYLVVDYKLQTDDTHNYFVIWVGSDTDLTGKVLTDLETYQVQADEMLANFKVAGDASHSLKTSYEHDVTEARRVVIWAEAQYAADEVSDILEPMILTECSVAGDSK